MDGALWIMQIVLAAKLVSTAFTHGPGRARGAVAEALGRGGRQAGTWLWAAAGGCLAGAALLALPGVMHLPGELVAGAAAGLAAMFLASVHLHARWRAQPRVYAGLVLAGLAAFVAYGRWALAPL
jgi:hypothetical protein